MDIEHEDAETFKSPNDGRGPGPVVCELLAFLGIPVGHDLFGELWRVVEGSAGEVEDEGGSDDGHFDDTQFVIEVEDIGYGEPCEAPYTLRLKACVDISLAGVW